MMETAEKLAKLRAELSARGLDGFIVPMADEYQNEYVPEYAQRIRWLSGFDGSFGLIIVLADKAALFVDGRYTLQARNQVDGDLFDIRHITDAPPKDWLAAHLSGGDKLGFDPWLHTEKQIETFDKACDAAGAALTPVKENPLDAVWEDQPRPPAAPIAAHDLAYAGETSADKRNRLAESLQEDDIAAAVLTAPDSIAWLLNVRGGDVAHTPLPLSHAVLNGDGSVDWFVAEAKIGDDLAEALDADLRRHPPDAFLPALEKLAKDGKRIQVDPDLTPVRVIRALGDAGAALHRGSDPCQLPKATKNETELEGARNAHIRDGAALCRFLAWIDAEAGDGTIDELAAVQKLGALRAELDLFRDLSFDVISGAGPNGAIVHYRVTEDSSRTLEPGGLYLVDSGGQFLDGTTDVTRTVPIGDVREDAIAPFTRVLKGHIALATLTFPSGTTGSQLDALARAPLWRAGLDYDHGTGHGVGSYLGVHEGPQRISKVPNTIALRPGMIVSNEPGYYRKGEFGIRIENLVAVCESDAADSDGKPFLAFETLTLAPIDHRLIEKSLLEPWEREWLNAYHARVRETLSPLLDAETRAWLERATKPL